MGKYRRIYKQMVGNMANKEYSRINGEQKSWKHLIFIRLLVLSTGIAHYNKLTAIWKYHNVKCSYAWSWNNIFLGNEKSSDFCFLKANVFSTSENQALNGWRGMKASYFLKALIQENILGSWKSFEFKKIFMCLDWECIKNPLKIHSF